MNVLRPLRVVVALCVLASGAAFADTVALKANLQPSSEVPPKVSHGHGMVNATFDTSSRIRFFRNNNDTSDVTVPTLTQITGIEFVLTGASEKTRYGKTTPETATLRTGAFFSNRTN